MSGIQLTQSTIEEDPGFATFWGAYPRRTAKGAARKAWASAIKKHDGLAILHCLYNQIGAGSFSRDAKFIPHPSTWLNQERWSDDLPTSRRPEFRNGALEALARQWEAGDSAPMLEGPAGD